jgi:hypothetical protein
MSYRFKVKWNERKVIGMYDDIPQEILELGPALEKAIEDQASATRFLCGVISEILTKSDDGLLAAKFVYQVLIREYLVLHEIIPMKDAEELMKKIDETIEEGMAKRIKPIQR